MKTHFKNSLIASLISKFAAQSQLQIPHSATKL